MLRASAAAVEKFVTAFAPLAENLAEIAVAARRARLAGDVVEANRNGEFGTQAKRLAGLAFGQEDAAAQILAGHIEERIGRLQHRHFDETGAAPFEQRSDFAGESWGPRASHEDTFCISSMRLPNGS